MRITIGTRPDHGFDEPLGPPSDCHRRIEPFLQIPTTVVDRHVKGESLDAGHRLFPTAARVLSAGQVREIGSEMAARRR